MARNTQVAVVLAALAALPLTAPASASDLADRDNTSAAVSAPRPFGSFLQSLGGKRKAPTRLGHIEFVVPFNNGEASFIGWTFIEGNRIWERKQVITEAFLAECSAHGGTMPVAASPQDREDYRLALLTFAASGTGLSRTTDTNSAFCIDLSGAALSAIITIRSGATHLGVYVLTPQAANAALTSQRQRSADEAAYQARMARQRADWDRYTLAWRQSLTVGSESNCGAIIQLRGPMVEIALSPRWRRSQGPATLWLRREQIYPAPRPQTSDGLIECMPAW